MKETGSTIRPKVKENTPIWMVLSTMDNGKKINSMDREEKHGLMGLCMKETMCWAKSMEEDSSNGQMGLFIGVIFTIITLRVMESISGQMEELILVNGRIIKCMDMEYLLGPMGEDTKVPILRTKSKGKVNFTGQTEEGMKETGSMESNTVKETLWQ